MSAKIGPLLTCIEHEQLSAAARDGTPAIECSLDLGRTRASVEVDRSGWVWYGRRYAHLPQCKDRTVYHWTGDEFQPVARYSNSLIKLVPTQWGAPTFEIDGIKMLPTLRISPFDDAERKVASIRPRGKTILDTCGGLGYFAAWCLQGQADRVLSFEKNPDVIWLRSLNPWSPEHVFVGDARLTLTQGDIVECIQAVPDRSADAVLHDPPRFGIAGELYSLAFYQQLARVLRPKGKLFHYAGSPNKLSSGRNMQEEVAKRLQLAGFATRRQGDGIAAEKK